MARNTGNLAAANDTLILSADPRTRFTNATIKSGTFGTAVVRFQGSNQPDVSTAWVPLSAVKASDLTAANGSISLTDNAVAGFFVFSAGFLAVRVQLVSIGSGSVDAVLASDEFGQQPLWLPTVAAGATVEVASADGAIAIKEGTVFITKGSAAALTLAAPTPTTDDGKRLSIITTTAAAHTVTNTTPGFNNGSTASDVATFTGAIGNGMVVRAYNGVWYTESLRNVALG